MKKLTGKRIAIIAVILLVILRMAYIVIGGEIAKIYFTSAEPDLTEAREVPCQDIEIRFTSPQKRLHSLEFLFHTIAADRLGAVTVRIESEGETFYQTQISLVNINDWEWKRIYVNMPLDLEKVYSLRLHTTEECTQVPMLSLTDPTAASPEIKECLAGQESLAGAIAIKYGYQRFPGRLDRFLSTSLWGLFLAAVLAGFYYWQRSKAWGEKILCTLLCHVDKNAFFYIGEIFLCLVLLDGAGIEFQSSTKIIGLILSLVSARGCEKRAKMVYRKTEGRGERALLFFLYIYSAFALVGQRILIYPLNAVVTLHGLWVFVAAILWFVPVVNLFLCGLEWLGQSAAFGGKRLGRKTLALIFLVVLLLPAAYNLFANNPGISTPDTIGTMAGNAHHLHGAEDWHPVFYSMVLRVILSVWDSTYAVILVQYFFWCYVMCESLFYLRRKGVRDSILLMIAGFSGMNASNFLHLNTIWKDIPYTLSLLWAFVLLAKLTLDSKFYRKKHYIYLELIIALVGVFLYRKNGAVAYVVIVLSMAAVLWQNRRVWCAIVISALLIGLVKFPIYWYFDIQDTGRRGMYIGLGQDILGAYYAGGEVSEDTLQMINQMTDYKNSEYVYTPTYSNQSYDVEVTAAEFIRNYIDTFVHNPVSMARAVVAREDVVWNLFPGADAKIECMNATITMDENEAWNLYYPKRVENSFTSRMYQMTAYTVSNQWINMIEWRSGLFTLLTVLSLVLVVIRRGSGGYLVIFSPIAGHILGLLCI